MEIKEILNAFSKELERAKEKFPTFPVDPVHAVAIMAEEAGEATQASLLYNWEKGDKKRIEREVIQTGAMCIRILSNIGKLKRCKPLQIED